MTFIRKRFVVRSAVALSAGVISVLTVVAPSVPAGAGAGPSELCNAAEPVNASLPSNSTVYASFTFSGSAPYIYSYSMNNDNSTDNPNYFVNSGQELSATHVYNYLTNFTSVAASYHGYLNVNYACS